MKGFGGQLPKKFFPGGWLVSERIATAGRKARAGRLLSRESGSVPRLEDAGDASGSATAQAKAGLGERHERAILGNQGRCRGMKYLEEHRTRRGERPHFRLITGEASTRLCADGSLEVEARSERTLDREILRAPIAPTTRGQRLLTKRVRCAEREPPERELALDAARG